MCAAPTPEQMQAAIEASGYMFEQRVASDLEALEFHVETNSAFLDREQEKSRELDARAIKVVHKDASNRLQVVVELLVECKDMTAPMVFITRNKNKRELEHPSPTEFMFPQSKYKKDLPTKGAYTEVPAFQHLELARHHYYYAEPEKATQFAKIARKGSDWQANHDGIYDSLILPMAKALESRRKAVKETVRGGLFRSVWLFFPIVVLSGDLFSLKSEPTMSPPRPRKRVSFVRELDSEIVRGHYLTDFVAHNHFTTFVDRDIMGFASKVVEICKANPTMVRGGEA